MLHLLRVSTYLDQCVHITLNTYNVFEVQIIKHEKNNDTEFIIKVLGLFKENIHPPVFTAEKLSITCWLVSAMSITTLFLMKSIANAVSVSSDTEFLRRGINQFSVEKHLSK